MTERGQRTWSFDSVEEREGWLDQQFPKRTVSGTPGMYWVPGGMIGVVGNDVTFYPGSGAPSTADGDGRSG